MALVCKIFSMNCQYIRHITKPVKWSLERSHSVKVLTSGICYRSNNLSRPLDTNYVGLFFTRPRPYCTQLNQEPEKPKEGLVQRLKSMYRDYWYVTVPVHMVTSAVWFGSFYYLVRSGLDVLAILESVGVSEKLLTPLRDSSAGYVALTLALYKLVTPLRYAVTLGGTTFAIKKLKALGLIKPVPTKARLKEMYQEKKDNFQDRKQLYQVQMNEKRNQLLEEMRRYKQQMKNKVKKM